MQERCNSIANALTHRHENYSVSNQFQFNLNIVYWIIIQKYQQQQPQTQITQTMEDCFVNTVHSRYIMVNFLQNLTKDIPYLACNVEVRGVIYEFIVWRKWSRSPSQIAFNIDYIRPLRIESL